MLTTLTFGVLSSIAAEIITKINKKLAGTVLQGYAAFLLALGMAVIGSAGEVFLTPGFVINLHTLSATFAEIWTTSQIFFVIIVEKLGLSVQPDPVQAQTILPTPELG